MRKEIGITLVIVGAAILIAWFIGRDSPTDNLERLAAEYRQATFPLGSHLVREISTDIGKLRGTATWTIVTNGTWDEYTFELKGALGSQFRQTESDETAVEFRRSLADEIHILLAELLHVDQQKTVLISLTVEPW